jgi:hypothetical protein
MAEWSALRCNETSIEKCRVGNRRQGTECRSSARCAMVQKMGLVCHASERGTPDARDQKGLDDVVPSCAHTPSHGIAGRQRAGGRSEASGWPLRGHVSSRTPAPGTMGDRGEESHLRFGGATRRSYPLSASERQQSVFGMSRQEHPAGWGATDVRYRLRRQGRRESTGRLCPHAAHVFRAHRDDHGREEHDHDGSADGSSDRQL